MADHATDSTESSEETSGSVWSHVIAGLSAVLGLLTLQIAVFYLVLLSGPKTPSLFCTPTSHLSPYHYIAIILGGWGAMAWVYTADESTVHTLDRALIGVELGAVLIIGVYGAAQYPLEWHMCEDLFGAEKAYAAFRPLVQEGAHLCASLLGVAGFVQYRSSEGSLWKVVLRFAPAVLFLLLLAAISLSGATPVSEPPVGDPGIIPIPPLAPTH